MSDVRPARIRGRFFTPGTWMLFALMAIGYTFGLVRLLTGLSTVTNLSDAYPWGIWIAIDVACGVALAAGGFTTAALIDVFGGHRFRPLLRPAILTAWLGYSMVGLALVFDLGRYWNGWRPVFHWQGNSVLFEVGMCVLIYLFVLTVEMAGPVIDGLRQRAAAGEPGASVLRRMGRALTLTRRAVRTVLPLFILAGVVLSCMHQSSLGALMVIAPTKMSPLWYTPLLPLLFLASALMVGFPMVIIESIVASRSFGREPETALLGELAAKIPWFLGAYGILRIGDLVVRWPRVEIADMPGQTIAFLIEIVCLLLPFFLLLRRQVRESSEWLFLAALLVTGGVVLNRINVFLVAYEPPFPGAGYFPTVGEVSLTVAIVSTLMLLYRICAFLFPILPATEADERAADAASREPVALTPVWAWGFRALASISLLGFAALYAIVHEEAVSGEIRATRWGRTAAPVRVDLPEPSPSEHVGRPEGYKRVYRLSSAILNDRADFYEPVRFTHVSHDEHLTGDCGVCHHRFSMDEDDRVGFDLREFHMELDVRLGGACASCHDMDRLTIQRCDSCHWLANEEDARSRPGLRGAYHQLCIGCHEGTPSDENAPVDCAGCHHPNTPDHHDLVAVAPSAGARDVTAECLRCHADVGRDVLKSAHWRWTGHSPGIFGGERGGDLGPSTLVNNYLIGVAPNLEYCATCHIGVGGLTDAVHVGPEAVDCLVCHDTTGTYRKQIGGGGAPDPSVDLVAVARSVGRPSRATCGTCHFFADGGPNVKHGDLEPPLADPPAELDVHMGRHDMRCQDCHTTEAHRIAGMSASAPAVEGRVTCQRCHGKTPHGIAGSLSRHLDRHVSAVACEVCHVPSIAGGMPTRVSIDYERAERYGPVPAGPYGTPVWPEQSGVERWEANLVPRYRWHDGSRQAYAVDDRIDPRGPVSLNEPLGQRRDPRARIQAFKLHRAVQPYDVDRRVLVLPQLWGGFWTHFDLSRAISDGMRTAGLEYSGKYGFAETLMYTGVHHEVVPSAASLGCRDCHADDAVACGGCHRGMRDGDPLPALAGMSYPAVGKRLDFAGLGYEDDPARSGGRFAFGNGPGRPPR